MRTLPSLAGLLAVMVLAAACGANDSLDGGTAADDADSNQAATESTSTTRFDVELVPATTKVPISAPPVDQGSDPNAPVFEPGDDAVAFAIADLAYRLGVDAEGIVLVEQQEMMWRDGSLGCPQSGFSYTQALVDGSRIVLQFDGEAYDYHQGRGRAPFLCENPSR